MATAEPAEPATAARGSIVAEPEGVLLRFTAFLIDIVIVFAATGFLRSLIPAYDAADEANVIIGIVVIAVWFNYFAFCEWRWGRTIGKAALDLRVVRTVDKPLSWNPCVFRNLFLIVDLFAIGPILIATTKRKQRLGDLVSRTTVVRERRRPEPSVASPGAAAPPGAVPLPPPPPPPPPPVQSVTPRAGWYPDPSGEGYRYWDGHRWTDQRAGLSHPPPRPSWWAGLPEISWGPSRVALGVVALIVLSVIEVIPVAIADPHLKSLAAKLITQALLAVTLVGIVFVAARGDREELAPPWRLGLRRIEPSAIAWAFAALGVYFVYAAILNALFATKQEDLARDLGLHVNVFGAIASGVLIVGAAPFSEELFFRGFMFGGLRQRLPLPAAAAVSGAIFGLAHFGPGNLAAVGQLAGLGLILCLLYEKTGSLWPPILVHTINNAIAFAALAAH
jgi:membrane protease YdiL (CAAX protease family)/uncharacterized RDD family membrane protein YckC